MAQYIYTMRNVRKAVGDKVLLDNVTLSFLPGAKIGVVGPNGAGKSTVLKLMAGLDTASNGDAMLSPGYTVGILLQEPPLDETKDVLGNVMEAVRPTKELLERYEEVSDKMAVEYTEELGIEQGELLEKIEHAGGWDLEARVEQAMDALRTPPGDADDAAGRQREGQAVDEDAVAEALLEAVDLEDDVAEARAGRDLDDVGVDRLVPVGLGDELLEARETGLALGLSRLGVGADPLELALDLALALGVLLPLDLEAG
jgi:ATPase subunit of ABC transporter with duplicated ATPase domains